MIDLRAVAACFSGMLCLLVSVNGLAEDSANRPNSNAPKNASVFVIVPTEGQVLQADAPITVRFGLRGMGVAPAGIIVEQTGHHHLLIDQSVLPDLTQPLPASEHIVHFGRGQTETDIRLKPGPHTLQLILGNHYHIPHDPPVISQKVHIIVE